MAAEYSNLSNYDKASLPSAVNYRFGIVVSEWNPEITDALYNGAYSTLTKNGAGESHIITKLVPGSFELALGAQYLIEYAQVDAVICLGCIIQGETPHFDYISQAATQSISRLNLDHNLPVVFGVLTTNHFQQAKERAGGKFGNKGTEAAIVAIKMLALKQELQQG